MNYSGIIYEDMANGVGVRLSLFVSGCNIKCPGCFSPDLQSFDYGKPFTDNVLDSIVKIVKRNDFYDGISILGGDPLAYQNIKSVNNLITKFKSNTNKSIWLWSGYEYEQILDSIKDDPDSEICMCLRNILDSIDVLVDGPFKEELKDSSLAFRGSSNQRIIDVKRSIKENKIILFESKN